MASQGPTASAGTSTGQSFLDGLATDRFNDKIYISIDVIIAATCLAAVISLLALGVQLARPEQRMLVKKTTTRCGTYFLPHSPVLAPVMITIYCVVAIATEFVLKAYLWKGSSLVVIQRLSLMLPMPLFLWAWLSAFSSAFAWHLTPSGASKTVNMLRLRPRTLNIICWTAPVLIFAAELIIAMVWPVVNSDAKAHKLYLDSLLKAATTDDVAIAAAQKIADLSRKHAERIYQANWGIWAVAYAACWAVYATYSGLLIALLGSHLESVDYLSAQRGQQRQAQAEAETIKSEEGAKDTEAQAKRSLLSKRGSLSSLLKIRSASSEDRYRSKVVVLRRNMRLVVMELVAFSIFTLCWCMLALAKAILGYKILNNHRTGPITVVGEIYVSTVFGLVAVSLMLARGINILQHGQTQAAQQSPQSSAADTVDIVEVQVQPRLPIPLAQRRGGRHISIALNVGSYVVPSEPSTPTASGMPSRPSSARFIPPSSLSTRLEGLSKGQDSYFTLEYPATPSSETPLINLPRKSSVTFTDEILSLDNRLNAPPTLATIGGSPMVPSTSL